MNIDATDQEILSFIETWVNCLAREDYEGAYAHTKHDSYYEWSPKLIEAVINGYGLPEPHPSGEVFKVTSPEAAEGTSGQQVIDRGVGPEGCLGYAYYDLPLNGEWSDLTASFRLENRGEELNVILEEIHVM